MKAALALAFVPLAIAGSGALLRGDPPPAPPAVRGDRLPVQTVAFQQDKPMTYDHWKGRNPQDDELGRAPQAEAVPVPPARPAAACRRPVPQHPGQSPEQGRRSCPLCARHGLRQVWVSRIGGGANEIVSASSGGWSSRWPWTYQYMLKRM
jgi:hypothetical protein